MSKQTLLNDLVDNAYNTGLEAGLNVAREIASWLLGQENVKALEQIDRMRVVLRRPDGLHTPQSLDGSKNDSSQSSSMTSELTPELTPSRFPRLKS